MAILKKQTRKKPGEIFSELKKARFYTAKKPLDFSSGFFYSFFKILNSVSEKQKICEMVSWDVTWMIQCCLLIKIHPINLDSAFFSSKVPLHLKNMFLSCYVIEIKQKQCKAPSHSHPLLQKLGPF
jgi:hypothetical protein